MIRRGICEGDLERSESWLVDWPVVVVVVVKVGVDWEQNVEMSKCRDDSRW